MYIFPLGFTPRSMTPKVSGGIGGTPSVRDNLSINREEAFYDDMESAKHQQMENKNELLAGLSSLPKPTNDFEIVVPEVCIFFLNLFYFSEKEYFCILVDANNKPLK